jgi:hypothetical protein
MINRSTQAVTDCKSKFIKPDAKVPLLQRFRKRTNKIVLVALSSSAATTRNRSVFTETAHAWIDISANSRIAIR